MESVFPNREVIGSNVDFFSCERINGCFTPNVTTTYELNLDKKCQICPIKVSAATIEQISVDLEMSLPIFLRQWLLNR